MFDDRKGFQGKHSYIPLQYTGLKDKNGVEIYEGDIVQNLEVWTYLYAGKQVRSTPARDGKTRHPDGHYELLEVKFEDSGWWPFNEGHTAEFAQINVMPEYVEVIGNIYENKDLLK